MSTHSQRKLPIDIQSFEGLRRDGYIYVDKTPYIWNLVEMGEDLLPQPASTLWQEPFYLNP